MPIYNHSVKMLKLPLLSIIALASGVLCWKPIISPSSFSISQHHPALGHSNALLDGADTSADSTITYHGNSFLNNHAHGHEFLGSDDHSEDSEARVVNGGAGYHYEPKFLTGLPSPSNVSESINLFKMCIEISEVIQFHTIEQVTNNSFYLYRRALFFVFFLF